MIDGLVPEWAAPELAGAAAWGDAHGDGTRAWRDDEGRQWSTRVETTWESVGDGWGIMVDVPGPRAQFARVDWAGLVFEFVRQGRTAEWHCSAVASMVV